MGLVTVIALVKVFSFHLQPESEQLSSRKYHLNKEFLSLQPDELKGFEEEERRATLRIQ